MTDTANSNAFDCLTFAIGLLTVPLLGVFHKGLCLASVDLLMLRCVCRLVEWEAIRSAGHTLAAIIERRPTEERHSTLQQPQRGLPAPHMQAQPQVHSKPGLCVCPHNSGCATFARWYMPTAS